MKFARVEFKGQTRQGIVENETIHFIDGSFLDDYRETSEYAGLKEVGFLPPVVPTKVVCIGLNYRNHVEEVGEKVPEEPLFFYKPPSCLIGHEKPVIYPRQAEKIGYEGELGLIIKEKMKDVAEKDALKYLFGCTCFNDMTERRLSKTDSLLAKAKGFDTFGPCGPFVVTGLDPNNLNLTTRFNSKLVQQANTGDTVFTVERILSYLSEYITLYPGDIVITGTPKGIDLMLPGDIVEIEIEGIGVLRNTVKAAEPR